MTFNGNFTYAPAGADAVAVNGGTFGTCGVNQCHNNGQSSAAILGVHLEHGARGRDEQLHGVPRRDFDDAGEQLARAAPDDADGRRGGLQRLPHDRVDGDARERVGDLRGSFTYTPAAASAVAVNGGTFGSCGVNQCHNNGQSGTAVSPYTWGTQLGGGTNSCTECHGTDAATLTTQAHPKHNGTPVCGTCHASATLNTHTNGSITIGGGRRPSRTA